MAGETTAARTTRGAFQVVLQPADEGAYLFVFHTESSAFPEEDYFYESAEQAREVASQDYGVTEASWMPWIGPSLI